MLAEKMLTSAQIVSLFKSYDENTPLRNPNLRRFIEANHIPFCRFSRSKWIIDAEAFIKAVNPRGVSENREPPRIRSFQGCMETFISNHPHLQPSLAMMKEILNEETVFKIKNGGHWLVNYDEFEYAALSKIYKIEK